MSDFKESGTITYIGEVQTFDSGFQKREFVIQTYGDYPQDIKFELLKDNVDNDNNALVLEAKSQIIGSGDSMVPDCWSIGLTKIQND